MSARARRVLVGVASTPLAALLVVLALLVAWIGGVQVPGVSGTTWVRVEKTAETSYHRDFTGPLFMLVIGNDFRPGVEGRRADALHLIGVNPQTKTATVINFPRDTAVPIPGYGTNKINAANTFGGPQLTAQTVAGVVGVEIPYTFETDFAGFVGMIDEVGGVDVWVPKTMRDKDSGSDFEPGPQRLSGERALAFSRDRKSFPTGDIARSENQGTLLIGALGQLQRETNTAGDRLRAIGIAVRHTAIAGLSIRELYDLYQLALEIDFEAVRNVTVPLGAGSGSNLRLTPDADRLFADFRDDATLQSY